MSIPRHRLRATAPLLLALLAACGTQNAPAEQPGDAAAPSRGVPATAADAAPGTSADTTESAADRAAAERLADRFAEAANAGDAGAVEATFARDARFDSAGRIYADRQEIMRRFLIPEVIDAGGKYHVRGREWKDNRFVVHYRYDTGSGGVETFTYSYLVTDGLIRDVIGRYE